MKKKTNRMVPYRLLIVFALFLLLRLPYIDVPLERDEGAYAYIGRMWFRGEGIPYLSVFDHKPPLVYIPYGIINVLSGDTASGIRIAAILYSLGILAVYYWLSVRFFGKTVGWVCALLLSVYFSSLRIQGFGFNTETLLLLPFLLFVAMVWIIVKGSHDVWWHWLGAGFFAAMAFWCKPVVLYPEIMIMVYAVVMRWSVRAIGAASVGFLIPSVCIIFYFWIMDAYSQFLDDVVFYNLHYAREGFSPTIFCSRDITDIGCVIGWLVRMPKTLLLLIIVGSVGVIKVLFAKKNTQIWLSLLCTIGMWLAVKSVGGKDWQHYYLLWLPGTIWIVGALLQSMWQEGKRSVPLIVVILLVSIVPFLEIHTIQKGPASILQEAYGSIEGPRFAEAVDVASWIKGNTKPDERVLVFANEPEIYYYTDRVAPGKHINTFGFLYSQDARQEWCVQLSHTPVDWIITYATDPWITAVQSDFGPFTVVYSTGEYVVLKRVGLLPN